MEDLLNKTTELLNQGKKCVVATVVEKNGDGPLSVGGRLIIDEEYNRYGTIAGGDLELMIIDKCKEILSSKENQLLLYNLSSRDLVEKNIDAEMICGGMARIFYEYFEPKPKLYVFGGAGNVGREICKKSKGLGFELVIVDRKKPKLDMKYNYFKFSKDFFEDRKFSKKDYFVIAMGDHEIDYEILKRIVEKEIKVRYLGMLASGNKVKELLERMEEEIGKNPSKLHSPIGLNIGGPTPPEIAISILSQIQKERYNIDKVEDMGVIQW